MNCKPGQMAMIVRRGRATGIGLKVIRACMGHVVRVVELAPAPMCVPPIGWRFEEPIFVDVDGTQWRIDGAADEVLQPLPDIDDPEWFAEVAEKVRDAQKEGAA